MTAFPDTYDELAVLRHYGATDEEIARRLAEREQMTLAGRYHADMMARGHHGPTLADHRARWADGHGREPKTPPTVELAEPSDPDGEDSADEVPDGTAADVLGWVGISRRRAGLALDVEQHRDSPRTSLIGRLRKLADG